MEQNTPVLAKKVWSVMRAVYLSLRKSISKKKLMLELNMMVKRGKISGKDALQNVMFHHHQQHNFTAFSATGKPVEDLDMMSATNEAVLKAMEVIHGEMASPALPGLGESPLVRQLRVTDSPFPMSGVDEDSHVDEAADRFINRFYDGLRRENAKAARGSA